LESLRRHGEGPKRRSHPDEAIKAQSGLLTWGFFGQGEIQLVILFPLNVVDLVRACFRDLVDSQNKLTFGRRVSAISTMIPHSAAEAREGETILRHGF
jgi:hypothetical protein